MNLKNLFRHSIFAEAQKVPGALFTKVRQGTWYLLFLFIFSSNLFAATYDIKVKTPAVENALNGRQSRYSELQSLKAQGAIGETNQGYVQSLTPAGGSIAEAENSDRRALYQAIVEQNGLGPSGLPQVEKVFGEVQREKARSDDSIQLPSGEWVKK